jgi:hypothetical protein
MSFVDELRDVAKAVRQHDLTGKELADYLAGYNASEPVKALAAAFQTEITPQDLADWLEKMALDRSMPVGRKSFLKPTF